MKKIHNTGISIKSCMYLFILLLFGLYGMKALFHPGFFTSLDGWHNIARLYHYDQSASDFQIPPRWISQLASGYGYPLFLFSFHAPWIIAMPFLLAGIGVITSVKIVLILGFVLSGIVMYFWLREVFGEEAGFLSGLIYMWTPYRFAKILVGASIGEATVFLFLPLFFWGLWRISKGEARTGILFGSLGISGLVLSHFMIVPIAAVFAVPFTLFLFIGSRKRALFFKRFFALLLLGVVLAAFYLFPLFIYSSDIKAKTMSGGFSTLYENHFVTLKQLIYSKWGYGPIIHSAKDGEISFQAGLAQWFGVAFSFLIILIWKFKLPPKVAPVVFSSLIAFGLSLFFMTDASRALWKLFHQYIFVDYPWRFLSLTTFAGSIIVGALVSLLPRFRFPILFLFIAIALFTNRNHIRVNQYTDIPLQLYVDSETTTNTFSEYLPRWSEVDIGKKPLSILEPKEGVTLGSVQTKTDRIQLSLVSNSPNQVTLNHLYFPGITTFVDTVENQFVRQSDGRMSVMIPSGLHTLSIQFTPTLLMRISDILTLVGISLWLGLFFHIFFKRVKNTR